MESIARKVESRPTNCTGPSQVFDVVLQRVTDQDVGATHPHYGGYCHAEYKIKQSDVGRLVERVTQVGYVCWYFTDEDSAKRSFNYGGDQ